MNYLAYLAVIGFIIAMVVVRLRQIRGSASSSSSVDAERPSFLARLWDKNGESMVVITLWGVVVFIAGSFLLAALGLIADCQYKLQNKSHEARAYFKRQELESRRQARRYRYPPRRARARPTRKSRPKAHSRRNNSHPDDPFYNLTVVESPPLSR